MRIITYENYARSLGLNFKKNKTIIILATSILAGSITAYVWDLLHLLVYCAPHSEANFSKQVTTRFVIEYTLLGAGIMLICDIISNARFRYYFTNQRYYFHFLSTSRFDCWLKNENDGLIRCLTKKQQMSTTLFYLQQTSALDKPRLVQQL
jgi:hypothetical protein